MRKTKDVTIRTDDPDNRDKGKTFRITEMPATAFEKWLVRATNAMARSGLSISDDTRQSDAKELGVDAVFAFGFRSLIGADFAEAEPLMDEMMACVSFVPDPKHPEMSRRLFDGDIEEVDELSTIWFLRGEVMELHTGFTMADFLSKGSAALRKFVISLIIPTSPDPLELSSEPEKQPS